MCVQGQKSLRRAWLLLTALVTIVNLLATSPQATSASTAAVDLDEFRRQNPDLTEFISLIVSDPQLSASLEFKEGTIFAPTNSALDEFRRAHPNELNNYTLLYHYVNLPTPLSDLEETSLSTELPGNLPVWITEFNSEFYVNGAKVLRGNKVLRTGSSKRQQIVHTINQVLEPTVPVVALGSKIHNPDAWKYLEFSQDYGISKPYNTSTFARHVRKLNRMDFFQSAGKQTFFLPVSDAFASTRIESVDNKAIDGHMVFGKAIFLGTNQESTKQFLTFETSAAAGNFPVKVTVDYSKHTNSWSVTSENLVRDPSAKHRKGKVRAEILKANIPVKNGVVHLISRPLVVIDSDVYKLMQNRKNNDTEYFYCVDNLCASSVHKINEKAFIKEEHNDHPDHEIEIQEFRNLNTLKRKARDEPLTSIVKIYREVREDVSLRHGSAVAATVQSFYSVKSTLYDVRNSEFLGLPKTLEEVKMISPWTLTNGQQFLIEENGVLDKILGDGEHGPLQRFFELVERFPEIKKILSDTGKDKRVTVFAPSSSDLENSSNFQELYQKATKPGSQQIESRNQLEQILKLHIVQHDITSEDIIKGSKNKAHPYSARPLAHNKQLYFLVTSSDGDGRDKISVVDGGGTSAIIKQADIGATNGVIHIVNHVLGIGDNTILDRLKTDPQLKSTYNISQQEGFHLNFKNKDLKFTFFAPYDPAWEGIKYESHAKHHILFEGLHGRHARNIMERHLIPREEKSLEDLYKESVTGNRTVDVNKIPTLRGEIRLVSLDDPNYLNYVKKYGTARPRLNSTRIHLDYQYVIFWENREIRVVQGNIKCTNGYLHIIDTVLMTPDDVFVNSARDVLNSPVVNYILMILLSLLLR